MSRALTMVALPHEEHNLDTRAETGRATSGKVIVLAFAALVVVVILYVAFGMPGMDHSPSGPNHDMENMQPALSPSPSSTDSTSYLSTRLRR